GVAQYGEVVAGVEFLGAAVQAVRAARHVHVANEAGSPVAADAVADGRHCPAPHVPRNRVRWTAWSCGDMSWQERQDSGGGRPGSMNAAEKSMNGELSSRAVGRLPRWWASVPIFWRVQIVGWSVFAVVDVVTNRLLEFSFPVAVWRTALIVGCFVLFTWGMSAFYASPRFRNRMSVQALGWVALLSLAGATVVGALLFGARELLGWVTRGRDALE